MGFFTRRQQEPDLHKQLQALKRDMNALADTLGDLQATMKKRDLRVEARQDATDEALHKLRGVVYGRKSAEGSAEKSVPINPIDKMSKAELRQHLGLTPGRPAPRITVTEGGQHED